ncbi:MAG: conjugal transfer protein TraX [Defluviitaleaceae bacterium]|nr:conjugal transfer protein TraX [Defluviitaleaceae bacterium]
MKNLSFDAYTLKWIAVIGMVLNHIAIAWASILPFGALLLFYGAGGLTYTIMAFFVVEGYKHTSNLKKYMSRLLIFGLIAQAFHPMVLGITAVMPGPFLNILFTINLSLIVLLMYDNIKSRFLFWLLFIVACVVAMFMDLMFIGILVPLWYYTIKEESKRRTLPGVISGTIWGVIGVLSAFGVMAIMAMKNTPGMEADAQYLLDSFGFAPEVALAMPTFAIGCFLGAILIRNYNGERGKKAKWLFYIAYPLHLALIAAVSLALGLTEFNLFGFIG